MKFSWKIDGKVKKILVKKCLKYQVNRVDTPFILHSCCYLVGIFFIKQVNACIIPFSLRAYLSCSSKILFKGLSLLISNWGRKYFKNCRAKKSMFVLFSNVEGWFVCCSVFPCIFDERRKFNCWHLPTSQTFLNVNQNLLAK